MIVLLTTEAHDYTNTAVRGLAPCDIRPMGYHRAFRARRLPRATWVFGDLDRLGFWELELAARLHRVLAAAGLRVLNDPARLRQRFDLLRALHVQGLNAFDVWRVVEGARPPRYPVFLRTECAHRGVLSDLLHDAQQVAATVAATIARGVPARELLLVEYCAQPVREGLFRKWAMFRVGDRMVPALAVFESHWMAKGGELGIAGDALYEDERLAMLEDRHAPALRAAFDVAHTEYGRADFGLVDGRPQVYEINTNPTLGRVRAHPFPARLESDRLSFTKLVDAFAAIDTPRGGPDVVVDDAELVAQRRHDRWMTRPRWMP
jgi:hypothetical protein